MMVDVIIFLVMLMLTFNGAKLKELIKIDELFTVHYFEYSKDYSYVGEKHDFWEFVYVDKGEIIATADDKEYPLDHGKIIFHKPNQWHTLRANGSIAPNIVIVSFSARSKAMKFFEDKIMAVGQAQKSLMSKIIVEFSNSFTTPLSDTYACNLTRAENQTIGSEQLLKMYLTELLILFMRDNDVSQYSLSKSNSINSTLEYILAYMNSQISQKLTLDDLCVYTGMSKASVSALFANYIGKGPIEYFIDMKTEVAKKHLREDNYNITQIAYMLGYSTVHYFSRQFKKVTGMTPSQYSNSVKAIVNKEKSI